MAYEGKGKDVSANELVRSPLARSDHIAKILDRVSNQRNPEPETSVESSGGAFNGTPVLGRDDADRCVQTHESAVQGKKR